MTEDDSALDWSGPIPAVEDLERVLRREVLRALDYLQSDPPLSDLANNVERILSLLDSVSAVENVEDEALQLAVVADLQFVRLGKWRSWQERLWALYSPTIDRTMSDTQQKLYQCFVRFFLRRGDAIRANMVINHMLSLADVAPDAPLSVTRLAASTVAIELSKLGSDSTPITDLLILARLSQEIHLVGMTYAVATRYYANRLDATKTFEYGQMIYSLGIAQHQDILIIDGLYSMAVACQVTNEPNRALKYVSLAMQYSYWIGDIYRLDFMWHMCGVCHYQLGNYEEAVYYFESCLDAFKDSGHYYAVTLLSYGLSLMRLKLFDRAEKHLNAALDAWITVNRPVDQLYAKHGLAFLYFMAGRFPEAVKLGQDTLDAAEALGDACNPTFLNELRGDVERFRQALKGSLNG